MKRLLTKKRKRALVTGAIGALMLAFGISNGERFDSPLDLGGATESVTSNIPFIKGLSPDLQQEITKDITNDLKKGRTPRLNAKKISKYAKASGATDKVADEGRSFFDRFKSDAGDKVAQSKPDISFWDNFKKDALPKKPESNGSFFSGLFGGSKNDSFTVADDDFLLELAQLEYDPELYPNNFIEIDGKEGLTKDQKKMIEEFSDQPIWTDYQVDGQGRPVQATAYITHDSLPTEDRPSFSSSTRVGGELVDGYYDHENETWRSLTRNENGNVISQNAEMQLIGYRGWLYNKSHLIAWSLGGNMLPENLVLGTRAQNVGNFENKGGQASMEVPIREVMDNHPDVEIFYQVTPVYRESDDIVPVGVYSKAYSVNDDGQAIDYATYNFNNQEGIELDYKTGAWKIVDDRIEVIKTSVDYHE